MNLLRSHWHTGAIAFLLFAAIPLWLRFGIPWLERIPTDFHYRADVVSYDNFYDEETDSFSGEQRSVTRFAYNALHEKENVMTVRNSFDVRKATGEKIFSVERLYGIDPLTWKHVLGAGDHDREGSLFAPRHLKKGEPFTYWHINYDGPAHLQFVGDDVLFGLPVFRYETRYEGVSIDQTKNLGFLPGVGITRGVKLEPYLQLWIEPTTGHLVKYADDTIAYYYDLHTGEKLHPWNHFRNTFALHSVKTHAKLAQQERTRLMLMEYGVSALLFWIALLVALSLLRKSRVGKILLVSTCIAPCVMLAGVWLHPGTGTPESYAGPVEHIRLGAEEGLLNSPIWIAEHNGYFREFGLDVEIAEFSSGRAALSEMLTSATLDMATVAQTPVVRNSFTRNDFAILSGIVHSSNDVKILVRTDSNIGTPLDLKGKKIGIAPHTTGHYFLGLFLAEHGLAFKDVTLVELDTSSLPQAIQDGHVDAISTWEPHINNAKKLLGDGARTLESAGTFREDFYLTVLKDWAKDHPESLKRFLMAIDRAEAFIVEHPTESQSIVAKKLGLDFSFVSSVWNDFAFGIFLDQALLISLEQQARWMMGSDMVQQTEMPNFLDFITFDALEAVKPDAISIIR